VNAGANTQGGADASLILFVTGDAPRSQRARANLSRALKGLGIEAGGVREVDLMEEPRRTVEFGVFATPALVRLGEEGVRDVIYGDLSEADKLQQFLADITD
jgi:circadian clock protein KaiB